MSISLHSQKLNQNNPLAQTRPSTAVDTFRNLHYATKYTHAWSKVWWTSLTYEGSVHNFKTTVSIDIPIEPICCYMSTHFSKPECLPQLASHHFGCFTHGK